MYKPIDPYTGMRSTYNYTMRGGTYPPRYVLFNSWVLQSIVSELLLSSSDVI